MRIRTTVGAARYWLELHPAVLTDAEQALVRDLQEKSRADIALYAYTHLAPEGGIELEPFPAIGAWLARVRAQPGYVGIEWQP